MKVGGQHYRSIWRDAASGAVRIIDQRWLPHEFKVVTLSSLEDFAVAIRDMWVRGAPLIGATAAYGMAEAMTRDASDANFEQTSKVLNATRPTAVNLAWALQRCRDVILPRPPEQRADAAWTLAHEVFEEDIEINRRIGEHGLALIKEIAAQKPPGEPVRLLTHCNA
ncbi:MAG: S-methyl-5-thioribose-1-phosphate isomerase, partial [Arenibacterium sp.]